MARKGRVGSIPTGGIYIPRSPKSHSKRRQRSSRMARRAFTVAIESLLLLLAAGIFVAGAASYIVDQSIELAACDDVYQITIAHGTLTVSNAPQLRMEDALLHQWQAGYTRAGERAFDSNEWLEMSKVWGTKYYLWPKQREKLVQESLDANASVQALRRMRPAPTARPTPLSYSCRGRTAVSLSAVPWLAMILAGAALRRIRAAKQSNSGLCAACGYDLRASKERCPECGTPVLSRTIDKTRSHLYLPDQ